MILKVAFAQHVFDHYKHDSQRSKDGLHKKESTSFASVLDTIIKFQINRKAIT